MASVFIGDGMDPFLQVDSWTGAEVPVQSEVTWQGNDDTVEEPFAGGLSNAEPVDVEWTMVRAGVLDFGFSGMEAFVTFAAEPAG